MKNVVIVTAFSLVFASCGKKGEEAETATGLDGAVLQSAVVEANASDAVEAASAGEMGEVSQGLNLVAGGNEIFKTLEKNCVANEADGSAVVTITAEFEHTLTLDKPAISIEHVMKGSGKQTRTWDRPGDPIACVDRHAVIDFSGDVAGLKLVAVVERSRENAMTILRKRSGKETRREQSFELNARREVEWVKAEESETALVRTKKIVSSAKRNLHIANPNGKVHDVEISLATKEGAPLMVKVERAKAAPFTLQSKTLVSGILTATLGQGNEVETTFDNLKFSVEGGQCAAVSGAYVVKFGGSASEKTVSCSAEAGEISCKDEAGNAVEALPPACDPEDAQ